MLMLRMLAGRLWEGWKLIKVSYKEIEPHYVDKLGSEASDALSNLRLYFDDRRNLIATVRDKVGFHADRRVVERAFAQVPDDVDLGDYLCRT